MDLRVPQFPPTDPDMHIIVTGGSECVWVCVVCVSEWGVSVCDPLAAGIDSSTPTEAD